MIGQQKNSRDDGWTALLTHHLEECRERYTLYMQRHDALVAQIDQMDDKRSNQLSELRREVKGVIEHQTDEIWSLLWRATFGIIAAMAMMIGGLFAWLHHTAL